MKKKLISCLLCASMVFTVIGCGDEAANGDSATSQSTVESQVESEAEVSSEAPEADADVNEGEEETPTNEEEASTALDAAGRIEFEAFVEGNEGLSTEASEDDTQQLCGLQKSGYAAYNVNLGDGGYNQVAIRYSSGTEGGKLEIRYMSQEGDLLGEVDLPGTGDWGNYETVNVDLPNLQNFGREKTLYFVFSGEDYLYNLNWFQLYKVADVSTKMEAENYAATSGITAEATSDTIGGEGDMNLGGIQNGAWTMYKINFGEGGMKEMAVRASSATEGGEIEVRLGAVDGQLVGKLPVAGTGDWAAYQDFAADMPDLAAVTGTQDVYLVYTGNDYLFNINYFQFTKGALDASARIEAEDCFELVGDSIVAEDCGAASETENGPTKNLGGVMPGTGAGYRINFGDGGYTKMKVRAASPMEGGYIIAHAGSMTGDEVFRVLIGDSSVYGTDWANYGDWDFEAVEGLDALTGTQTLYFEFQIPDGSSASHCFNINWYEFSK